MIDFQVGDLFYSSLGTGYLIAIDEQDSFCYPYIIYYFNKQLKVNYDIQELETYVKIGSFKYWSVIK